MRVALQSAMVLHRRLYRDSSLLLEVFTPDYGRVGLVARGARRPRSRLNNTLRPFTPLLLSWVARSELMTLTAAEESGPSVQLPPARLLSTLYLSEVLLLSLMIQELPMQGQRLELAYTTGKLEELRQLSHQLHGSASYCAACALKAASLDLELAILDCREDQVPVSFNRLMTEIQRLLTHCDARPANEAPQ